MKRIPFYLFILFILPINSEAQQKQGRVPYMQMSNTDKYHHIDTTTLRVWYALNATNTEDENTYLDLERLEVGHRLNRYASYFVWESDSLMTEDRKVNHTGQFSGTLLPRGRNGRGNWNEIQYHVLIIKNDTVTTYTREPVREFNGYYQEPYPGMTWSLGNDTATVYGYLCQNALCQYHGRTFEAWFTMEVPLSYGPWKFGGLPGLILKVYDVEHLYTFECVRMEAVAAPIKSLRYKSFKPISKKKVLKFERMINEDNHKVLSGHSGEKKPYEPLELE